MQIENDVEKYLNQQAKKNGWLSLKFVSPGNKGVPDRILIAPWGDLFFIELKRDDKTEPRALQNHWLQKLENYQQRVRVIHSKSEVNLFFYGSMVD